MAKQTKLILGTILFALLFLNLGANILSTGQQLLHWSSCPVNTVKQGNTWFITDITQEGQSPILHVNDEVLGVKGLPPDVTLRNPGYDLPIPAGSELVLVVRCNGIIHDVPVQTYRASTKEWFEQIGGWITLISFLLTGFIILIIKADDPQAWLLAIMLGTFTGLFNYEFHDIPHWLFWGALIARGLSYVFLPLLVHFFATFPRPLPFLSRWPKFLKIIYSLFLFIVLPHILLLRSQQMQLIKLSGVASKIFRLIAMPASVLTLSFLIAGIVALLLNYRRSKIDDRRKLHIVVLGCSAGFLNLILLVISEYAGFNQSHRAIHTWIDFALKFTLPLIPISFAYAIIKHQVIPISLIIRRGMRYLLVSHGSVLLEMAIFAAVITASLTFFFKWLFAFYQPQSMDSFGMTIGIISGIFSIVTWSITRRLHQKYLAPIIDRQFFRQSYDSHQIITGLAESLRSTSEQQQLLEEVATKLQAALQTEAVAIFLKEQRSGNFVSSYYCEYKPSDGCVQTCAHNFQLVQSSEVVNLLSGLSKCREVAELPIPDDELRILAQIKSALLLPLFGKEQMLGIISLGPRLGDLPFAREDEELLMSVANPVALAIENARLVAQMVADARHRQELEAENEARAKEFEEARQLQLSMLPRNVPQLPNLDIAAYMKTATEVGGDYYDFHLTSDGTLTIAVGDATGHGLKAGTIVTATKSLFNNLAVLPDIREIFAQSSRALKQMNLRSLYMAMTMIKLKGRELTVGSAGMPAVLIYRAQTNSIEEILLRGMPLGSVKNYPYKQQTLLLETDDVIFAMSDGFEERFAVSGEMIGYERAEQLLLQSAHQSANGIINEFVRIGDEWGSGRPQDDDVTFVVVKIKGD